MSDLRNPERAFVLRLSPGYVDRMEEALNNNVLMVGWAEIPPEAAFNFDWYDLREEIRKTYRPDDTNYYKAGRATGNLWRFLREMKQGDWVVVPYGDGFYVAEIAGEAFFDETKIEDDSAYRMPVKWLNEKKPISRKQAKASLQSRMKCYHTCAYAEDIVEEIYDALICAPKEADTGKTSGFTDDLRNILVDKTIEEIKTGKINDRGFEGLIASLLKSRGAREVQIVPRQYDKGVDVIATFSVLSNIEISLGVQARHHNGETGKAAVENLCRGMVEEGLQFGWVVTSAEFSEEAIQTSEKMMEEKGFEIELIDGVHLASLVVDGGLESLFGKAAK